MLYIVATPIGNLQDLSPRAVEVLSSVDIIAAEDTRRTNKLCQHYSIETKRVSFHEYSSKEKLQGLLDDLADGKNIALVTDAGTPAISDPGVYLVDQVRRELPNVGIISIPGPSAVTAALSISGFRSDTFCFHGYAPKKGGKRNTFFEDIAKAESTQVFFTTPHSILKDLTALCEYALEREIFVAREMTKIHEMSYRGTCSEVLEQLQSEKQRGEYVVVVSPI